MVAAGGTGGHLFPAFALAEELGRRGHEVDLVTEKRAERYGANFPARKVYYVSSATIGGRSPMALAKTGSTLAGGLISALRMHGEAKPAAIIGFGGYPTLPPLIAAWLRGIPVAIHEQNAVMGRANRLLARFASRVALSFEPTRLLPEGAKTKARMTGAPVRDAVLALAGQAYPKLTAGGKISLVVFGGSQGAQYFSDTVPAAVLALPPEIRKRLSLVQQCRQEDLNRVGAVYGEAGVDAELNSFFDDLPQRISNAHLVISRSGASTVAELAILGRPAILVPLPHALDNDQLENATRLQQAGGAWCFPQSDLTSARLADEIVRLLRDPKILGNASEAARNCGMADAVEKLADLAGEVAAGR